MESDQKVMISAFKFLSGETDHICRLCFAPTENLEISVEDSVKLQKPYLQETVTLMDMFDALGVTLEPSLPQVLCTNCSTNVTNSYLFQKFCEHSNEKWNEVVRILGKSLDQANSIGPNVLSAYLVVDKNDNIIFTSRKVQTIRCKKTVLARVRNIIKSRQNYVKIKQKTIPTECDECGEKFSSNFHLAKHSAKVHNKNDHPCKQCTKVFATATQLEGHTERVHYPKKLQCTKCAKMFSTERLLKYHDKSHHTATICKLCFIQFPSRKELRSHLDKHEEKKCPKCDKTFINRHTYKGHLKICGNLDHKQPRFFCDICGKGYVLKNGLKTHLKIDHGFGHVLSCSWCNKKFDAVSRLNNHIVKHTKERNYHCEQCGGKFVTRAALIYHSRLHTGERPFPCDLCDESFLSASRRMEHKRRKHFGPTKECHICHVKFVTKNQLRKHAQRHYNPLSKLYVPNAEAAQQIPGAHLMVNSKNDDYFQFKNADLINY